jgi:holin-like protein
MLLPSESSEEASHATGLALDRAGVGTNRRTAWHYRAMITALTLLLACQLAGELIARLLGLPVPGPVVGMLLLFTLLLARPRSEPVLRDTTTTLLRYLSLLFVPAGVGLIRHGARIRAELVAICVAVVVSTALTIAVSALVFATVARAMERRRR